MAKAWAKAAKVAVQALPMASEDEFEENEEWTEYFLKSVFRNQWQTLKGDEEDV